MVSRSFSTFFSLFFFFLQISTFFSLFFITRSFLLSFDKVYYYQRNILTICVTYKKVHNDIWYTVLWCLSHEFRGLLYVYNVKFLLSSAVFWTRCFIIPPSWHWRNFRTIYSNHIIYLENHPSRPRRVFIDSPSYNSLFK